MSTNLSTFVFQEKPVRTVIRDGEPWFVTIDVCRVLGYVNPSNAYGRVDADDLCSVEVEDSAGRKQTCYAVNEAGLYALVLGSDKPEAKTFKRWVTHEVLPSIRKTGSYQVPALIQDWMAMSDEDKGIAWLTERKQRAQAVALLEAAKPKVEAFDSFMDSQGTFLIRDVAKALPELKLGQNKMYKALRERGILQKDSTEPYQRYVDAGYFEVKNGTYYDPKSNVKRPTLTTRVTPKGQEFIRRTLSAGQQLHH